MDWIRFEHRSAGLVPPFARSKRGLTVGVVFMDTPNHLWKGLTRDTPGPGVLVDWFMFDIGKHNQISNMTIQ